MSLVMRIRAWPRNAATGAIVLVCLAGGNNDAPHYDGQHYMAGVVGDPRFEMSVSFGDDGWAARAVPQVGAIGWAPAEPERLDPLAAYYWRDAAIEVDRIKDGVVARRLTGTIAEATISEGRLVITCADLSQRLDKPFISATFAGTGGIEGGDFAVGRVKRRSFGRVWNVEGRLLDKANHIYEFGDPAFPLQGCTALRDKGRAGPLAILAWQGSITATLAALKASAPARGGGVFAPSIACAKWWTQPAGPLTADLQGETSGYSENVAGIAAQLLSRASGPAISNLAAAQAMRTGVAGLHVGDSSESTASALDRLLQRVTLIWTLLPSGEIVVREWTFGGSAEALQAVYIGRERTLKPVSKRQVGYRKNERIHGDGEISIALQADDVVYEGGETIEELKPAEQGATNSADPDLPFGPGGKTVSDVLLEVNQKIDVDLVAPGVPTGLALTSSVALDTDKRQIVTLKADWSAVAASDMAGYVLSVREGAGSWIEFKIGPTATHWEMPVPANKSFSGRILAYDVQGNRSAFSSTVAHTTAKDNAPPAVPTALSATASFSAIYLSLTAPADADVSAIEIWENTSSSTSGRTLVATVNALPGQAAGFTRSGLGTGVTRWYWTRAIDTSGNPSGYTASVSATTASINYGDFQGGLEPPSSGASLPNPVGYVGPKLFFNTANKKLYRYDASGPAWTAETDGADIKVASLTGDKVMAGEIGSVHLASYSVTASKMFIGDTSNMVPDPTMSDLACWTVTEGQVLLSGGTGFNAPSRFRLWNQSATTGAVDIRTTSMSVEGGRDYYFKLGVGSHSGTITVHSFVNWYSMNAAGDLTYLTTDPITTDAATTGTVYGEVTLKAPPTARVAVLAGGKRAGANGQLTIYGAIVRRASSGELIVDGAIIARHVAVNSLTGDRITAGTFTGDRFNTLTSLPGTITVGSTGVSIATMQAQADDPAVRVNAKSTLINPGKIVIAGSTTLSDWRHGGDNTKMDGGNLAANSVTANKVEIGARGISIEGLQFSYNKANNQVSWTAGVIRYTRDNGTTTGDPDGYVNVNAGSATWASGTLFVYWNKGASDPANGATVSLSNSTSAATANGTNTLVLATYKGGVNFIANYGQTIIDGATIKTRSVTTEILDVESVRASNMVIADLSNLVINNWTGGDMDGWSMSGPFVLEQNGTAVSVSAGVAGWLVRVDHSSGWLRSPLSTCSTDEKFYMELWIYRSTALGTPSSGTLIQARFDVDDGAGNLTATYQTVGSTSTTGGWIKLSAIVTAPANAKTVSLWCRPLTSGSVGRIYFARPIIRRASSAELIVNGSVTADAMAAKSITAENGAIANLAITNAKIGDLEVSTLKIANEAITKSYYASLASPVSSMTVNAQNFILSVTLTGVTAGEVLKVAGTIRITAPDDLLGRVQVKCSVNGGTADFVTDEEYKFDSDGGASTKMAMPILCRMVAPSAGTYVFSLYYFNQKSGSDAGVGTAMDVTRQRR